MKQNGYVQKQYGIKTKRFCQTLDLKNEPELIAAYKKLHEEGHVWREILDGIKAVGILEMEIYLLENRLFMIVETPEDFNWDESMAKLAKLPKQEEWEALTGKYQKTKDGATSSWSVYSICISGSLIWIVNNLSHIIGLTSCTRCQPHSLSLLAFP